MDKQEDKPHATGKPDLARRLDQVRRMVEQAQEKRYWQFVQAVLELRPWMGQAGNRHTIH